VKIKMNVIGSHVVEVAVVSTLKTEEVIGVTVLLMDSDVTIVAVTKDPI
jgi:hypothetical protein